MKNYIKYYMGVRKDPYLTDPANLLRREWTGYFIGDREVTHEEFMEESTLQSIKTKDHQQKMTKAYIIGGAFYLLNLIDTVVVIRLDIKRKIKEEQERFALRLNSDLDRVKLNLSFHF